MQIKILFLCLIGFLPRQQCDLNCLINSISGPVIYVNSYQALSDHIKNETVQTCPELIIVTFSAKGKCISANAAAKDDLDTIVRSQLKSKWKRYTLCVIVNQKLYVFNRALEAL